MPARSLADSPAELLALRELGIPLNYCERCREVVSVSVCPLCRLPGELVCDSVAELRFDVEAERLTRPAGVVRSET